MNTITINADRNKGTLSKHIYGHFAEHLGRCIYDGIWVGEDSNIPNVRGIRTDIVEALKRIKIPNLRWPGGCFADTYHWKDGIGPRPDRPSIVNVHWGGITEDNSFGTHEFLDLCEQLGTDPYICGNVGSGTVQEMAEWVEYVNSDSKSPMTAARNSNGRGSSWQVPYWGVGNENWGCGGWMRPEYYADLYRRFACFCRDHGDNKLFRIACGPNGENYRWTEVFMDNMTQNGIGGTCSPSKFVQGLALHYYTTPPTDNRSATEFGEEEWYGILHRALKMDELITRHSAIMDQYDPEKLVALIVDEWGTWYEVEPGTNPRFLYQQNTIRDALAAAATFDIFHKHNSRIKMANIAQTINVLQSMILTDGEKLLLTPTYHVFEMNSVHHDADLLDSEVTCGSSSHGFFEVPTLSASASRDSSGSVHLTISNLDAAAAIELTVELRGFTPAEVSGRSLTGAQVNTHNTFDNPNNVKPVTLEGLVLKENLIHFTLPARSVNVLDIS
jgi:alpha-L-arabinofuranosidase